MDTTSKPTGVFKLNFKENGLWNHIEYEQFSKMLGKGKTHSVTNHESPDRKVEV
jgi:hypothetical protein